MASTTAQTATAGRNQPRTRAVGTGSRTLVSSPIGSTAASRNVVRNTTSRNEWSGVAAPAFPAGSAAVAYATRAAAIGTAGARATNQVTAARSFTELARSGNAMKIAASTAPVTARCGVPSATRNQVALRAHRPG